MTGIRTFILHSTGIPDILAERNSGMTNNFYRVLFKVFNADRTQIAKAILRHPSQEGNQYKMQYTIP
jgi:hypothetical protein